MKPKLVIINRAVLGSGKTTALKTIEATLRDIGLDTQKDFAVHSTDKFFMVGEKYDFNVEKLNDYHIQNEKDFETSLKNDISVVVCDNTNILPWQCEKYTDLARRYGYKIAFLNIEPKNLSDHIETQRVTPENPSAHQVPEEMLKRNIEEWRIYNDLFKNERRMAINPIRHRHFAWDNENLCRVDTGIMAKHFDCDYLISLPSWWDKNELQKELQKIIQNQMPWRFDCVIHTCDKTDTMSLIWGLTTLMADKHIVLYPKDMDNNFIKNIEKEFVCNSKIDSYRVDAFDRNSVEKVMREKLEPFERKAFHLSGGSKIMFLAGERVARDMDTKAFIIDTDRFNVLLLNSCTPIKKVPSLSRVNDFLVANTYGMDIIADTDVNDILKRKELTHRLFGNCRTINTLTQKIQKRITSNKKNHTLQAETFEEKVGKINVKYDQNILKVTIENDTYEISGDSTKCLSYIIGGWFEEYIYLELIPLLQSGYIYDLQINTKLNTEGVDYQEFDIIFTDGYRLFVIECKSGGVKSNAVEKLANIKQRYGGINAICIVTTPFRQNGIVDMKIKENGLYLVQGGYCQYVQEIIQGYVHQ